MTDRFVVAALCLAMLASIAHAQTPGGFAASDVTPRQFQSPLQQNFGAAAAPAGNDRADDLTKRCKEIAASYNEAFRPAGIDQSNAVVPNYGHGGEQENTMQRYYQRRDAEKAYHDLGCR
jgi:hypothetical protein